MSKSSRLWRKSRLCALLYAGNCPLLPLLVSVELLIRRNSSRQSPMITPVKYDWRWRFSKRSFRAMNSSSWSLRWSTLIERRRVVVLKYICNTAFPSNRISFDVAPKFSISWGSPISPIQVQIFMTISFGSLVIVDLESANILLMLSSQFSHGVEIRHRTSY